MSAEIGPLPTRSRRNLPEDSPRTVGTAVFASRRPPALRSRTAAEAGSVGIYGTVIAQRAQKFEDEQKRQGNPVVKGREGKKHPHHNPPGPGFAQPVHRRPRSGGGRRFVWLPDCISIGFRLVGGREQKDAAEGPK
ncbi:hypothetical protein ZHAS_00010637 [Anopheles sinensis]|uniref:Uncharacterized protein n=1 Tax=Anopheles sinensis TaxID=74873 RepID=A0A084VY38_ANOSI|nr:hypothetical protein ZHAS_00010637 [Anopheles sinensis]